MSLDSLANVKTRLGITTSADDALLNALRGSAEGFIAAWCNRDFAADTFTEHFSGHVSFLKLRNFPVETVVSVKVDPARMFGPETELPTTGYVVHFERGMIQPIGRTFLTTAADLRGLVNAELTIWPAHPRTVRVVYTTAAAVPDDVKHAYALLVGHWYRSVKTDGATNFQQIHRQQYGDTLAEYAPPGPPPVEVLRLLEPRRMPSL